MISKDFIVFLNIQLAFLNFCMILRLFKRIILKLFLLKKNIIYSYRTSKESFQDETLCSYTFNICMAAITKYNTKAHCGGRALENVKLRWPTLKYHGQMYPCGCPKYSLETLSSLSKSYLGLNCTEYKSWVSSLEEPVMINPEFCPGDSGRKKYSQSHSECLWAAATASCLPGLLWAAAGRKTRYIERICSSCQQTTLPSILL